MVDEVSFESEKEAFVVSILLSLKNHEIWLPNKKGRKNRDFSFFPLFFFFKKGVQGKVHQPHQAKFVYLDC